MIAFISIYFYHNFSLDRFHAFGLSNYLVIALMKNSSHCTAEKVSHDFVKHAGKFRLSFILYLNYMLYSNPWLLPLFVVELQGKAPKKCSIANEENFYRNTRK